jgi:hypothetical protein
VSGGWRRLHNEELHNLYASPNIIKVFKSRRMGGEMHIASTEEMRNTKFWSENLKGRNHSENLVVDGIILEWILGRWGKKV